MAAAYSIDLRKKVMEAINRGISIYRLSRIFSISERTLFKWKKQYLETGSIEPKKRKTPPVKPIIEDLDKFRNFVEKAPDRTGAQMAEDWGNISPRTISSTLKRAGFTYKKNLWIQAKKS